MSFYWRITGKSRRTHRHRPGQRGPLRCIAAVPGHGSHGKTTRFLRRGFRVACSWHANPPWPDTKAADEKDGVFLKILDSEVVKFRHMMYMIYIYVCMYILYILSHHHISDMQDDVYIIYWWHWMETKMINEHSSPVTVLPHGSKSHRRPCDFATRPSEASEAIVPQTIGTLWWTNIAMENHHF